MTILTNITIIIIKKPLFSNILTGVFPYFPVRETVESLSVKWFHSEVVNMKVK